MKRKDEAKRVTVVSRKNSPKQKGKPRYYIGLPKGRVSSIWDM